MVRKFIDQTAHTAAMPTTLLRRFVDRFFDGADSNEAEASSDADDDDRFVPSRLDVSVRDAHGGGGSAAEREIRRIQQQAAEHERRNR